MRTFMSRWLQNTGNAYFSPSKVWPTSTTHCCLAFPGHLAPSANVWKWRFDLCSSNHGGLLLSQQPNHHCQVQESAYVPHSPVHLTPNHTGVRKQLEEEQPPTTPLGVVFWIVLHARSLQATLSEHKWMVLRQAVIKLQLSALSCRYLGSWQQPTQ